MPEQYEQNISQSAAENSPSVDKPISEYGDNLQNPPFIETAFTSQPYFPVPNGGSFYSNHDVSVAPQSTNNALKQNDNNIQPGILKQEQDYSYITTPARIAIYDNLKSAPRVVQIPGGPTQQYIEQIALITYQNAQAAGGLIPYTVIREVSENFIHANFNEVVVSVLDKGNTIRFSDQGPGIKQKNLVQLPGFTSATEPMKQYIRGVGSGLPIVKDYLTFSQGTITIEDNINQGSVVTISLVPTPASTETTTEDKKELTLNETMILKELFPQQVLGVTEVHKATNIPVASIYNAFSKLEEKGYVKKINKKRSLTTAGYKLALTL